MDKRTKDFLDANNFKSLEEAQKALDDPDISKCSMVGILSRHKSMDIDTRKKLNYSDRIFIPVIQCKDGIIFPVRDLTGGFTGTFAMFDGDQAFTIKPRSKEES